MKILNFILIIVLWNIISCNKDPFNRYGADISPTVTHSYSDVIEKVKFGESDNITISGKITETCPKKGCWMQVKVSDTDTLMVRFKDYGFFVPKSGVNQKNTVINGTASMDTVSVQMLRHFAEDAGKPQEIIEQITEPETVIHFIAEGVLIEK